MKRQKGITIIEMAIVIALIAILSAIGYPLMMKTVARKVEVRDGINALMAFKTAMDGVAASCYGYPYGDAAGADDFVDILLGRGCVFPSDPDRNRCSICSVALNKRTAFNVVDESGKALEGSELDRIFNARLGSGPAELQTDPGNSICGWRSSDLSRPGGGDIGMYVNVVEDYQNPRIPPHITYCGAVRGPGSNQRTLIVMNRDGAGRSAYDGNALTDPCPGGPWCRILDASGSVHRQGCCRAVGINY